jgi:hypothetical protein
MPSTKKRTGGLIDIPETGSESVNGARDAGDEGRAAGRFGRER